LALQGKADAVFFDDEGNVTEVWPMGALGSGLRFYYRIQEPVFHCLLVRDEPFVFQEVSTGPFDNEKTDYALWAPEQNKLAEIEEYLEELRFNLAIFVR
jgi:cupin fold WbuC family metalloprotein